MSRQRTLPGLVAILFLLNSMLVSSPAEAQGLGSNVLKNGDKLLGNSNYPAICYSGYRLTPRTPQNTPSVAETKEDLKILAAMGVRIVRTYDTTNFPHAERILQAIRELKLADPKFEMYVMMGAWIGCKDAYKPDVDHTVEDLEGNRTEIDAAIRLAGEYPDIVRIIAVGNEAMVTWQAHFVPASTILKWVNVLREARSAGRIPAHVMITTSDNWAALGGEERYRNDDLAELMRQMDYVSLHTYAFHDTFYNPALQWGPLLDEASLPATEQIARSIERAIALQHKQYVAVKDYLKSIGVEKEIHIGETGWASLDNSHYGPDGTRAASEYIAAEFYKAVTRWSRENNVSCFYFEAFDEPWKSNGTAGSEGHFGLFTVDGKAKLALWDLVDAGAFKGLSRGAGPVTKTHGGDKTLLLKQVTAPRHLKN